MQEYTKECQRDRTRGSGTEVQRLNKSGFKKERTGRKDGSVLKSAAYS